MYNSVLYQRVNSHIPAPQVRKWNISSTPKAPSHSLSSQTSIEGSLQPNTVERKAFGMTKLSLLWCFGSLFFCPCCFVFKINFCFLLLKFAGEGKKVQTIVPKNNQKLSGFILSQDGRYLTFVECVGVLGSTCHYYIAFQNRKWEQHCQIQVGLYEMT